MNVKNGINLKYVCKSFIVRNKSQGSIAKLLNCDELLYYTFIILSAAEKKFNIGEHLAKLQAKWWIVSCAPFALDVCP